MGASWWRAWINQNNSSKKGRSTYNRSRALLPFGTVVKSRPNGIDSYTSSNELGAQYVQPHQSTKKKRDHTWKACACLNGCSSDMFVSHFKSCEGENGVSGGSQRLHCGRDACPSFTRDGRRGRTSQKGWKTERPTVSLHLDELPS